MLPFENLSGDKEQDADAMRLADDSMRILPDSFVIARNTPRLPTRASRWTH